MTSLTVNGSPLAFQMDPQTPLLWALRDGANLTGAKYACGEGFCGACNVLIDGEVRAACTVSLGEAEGRTVTTIEGLSSDGSHPMQQAMVLEGAVQCGFCAPGIVMAGAALLTRNADPGELEVREALTNLCPCGTYPRLIRAVQRAGRIARGVEPAPKTGPVPALKSV